MDKGGLGEKARIRPEPKFVLCWHKILGERRASTAEMLQKPIFFEIYRGGLYPVSNGYLAFLPLVMKTFCAL
jgi:hypothetical protein